MISGPKLYIAVPEVLVAGVRCNLNGHVPDLAKVKKILDWPPCTLASEVRGFLGMCRMVHIFIDKFADLVKPLTELTKKNMEFMWTGEVAEVMRELKERMTSSHV